MPMSEEQRKQYDELAKLRAEDEAAEKQLQKLEEEKKKAEKEKQEGLRTGDDAKVKDAKADLETIAVSESSIHALLDQLKRNEALMALDMEQRGTSKAKIEEVRKRRYIVGPR
jgi:hypothetical protein